MMSSEHASGNVYLRYNERELSGHILPHGHEFDHTTFFRKGWWLLRGMFDDGREFVAQYCSPEYELLRAMYQRFTPEVLLRPVRFPDADGQFVVQFIAPGDVVPAGGEELRFSPVEYAVLVKAKARHEMVCLSAQGDATCIYSHRTPQGDIVQQFTGWPKSYV